MNSRLSRRGFITLAGAAALSLAGCSSPSNTSNNAVNTAAEADNDVTVLTMYYPVNTGGSAANLVDELCEGFNKLHEDIYIECEYTGNYANTVLALKKARESGNMPEIFISLANQRFSLTSDDLIMPLDGLIASDADGAEYLADFLPGFMEDSYVDGKVYSLPFQRSTEIVYYNKNMFSDAGLDPEKPPTTWSELATMGEKLTDFGHYGVGIALNPSSAQWTFTGFCLQNSVNGENLMSANGKRALIDTPENVEALQFWLDLQNKYRCMERGVVQWTDLPVQFLNQEVAMIYHTTGNMNNIKENAEFEFGCCYLPGKKRPAAPTGGGNLYITKGLSDKKVKAAWEFVRYCTDTQRAAQWSVSTGYVATRSSCYETQAMKAYYEKVPQARVAYDQLVESTCGPEMTTYAADDVWMALDNNIVLAVKGQLTAQEALAAAQAEADAILAKYQ